MPSFPDSGITWGEALARAKEILSRSPRLLEKGLVETEAEQLVMAAFRNETGNRLSRLEFYSNPGAPYSGRAFVKLQRWCEKRADGTPLQYLTGIQAFLDHEYKVGPGVLVPRPETEGLVLAAFEELKKMSRLPVLGLEVGLGSGVISIELLCAFPGLTMVASEFSPAAKKWACENASEILGAEYGKRLEIIHPVGPLDVLGPFERRAAEEKADFLISNPPYLTSEDEVEPDVWAGEPHEALFPGIGGEPADPLHFYRQMAEKAPGLLRLDGMVFLEVPHERARAIAELFVATAGGATILLKDLSARERVLVWKKAVDENG